MSSLENHKLLSIARYGLFYRFMLRSKIVFSECGVLPPSYLLNRNINIVNGCVEMTESVCVYHVSRCARLLGDEMVGAW